MLPQYTPMAPTLVREPFHRAGWVYEEKVDGWRCWRRRTARAYANGVDHARRFRDIAAAISKLSARTLVLDGEVAIFDEQLRSRFDWLREPDPAAVASPPVYMAFDVLYRDGRDLSARPLAHRRVRLESVIVGSELVFPVRRLEPDGPAAWKQVVESRYEGYVAKNKASVYKAGPTRRWLKVKQKDWTVGDDRWTADQQGGAVSASRRSEG